MFSHEDQPIHQKSHLHQHVWDAGVHRIPWTVCISCRWTTPECGRRPWMVRFCSTAGFLGHEIVASSISPTRYQATVRLIEQGLTSPPTQYRLYERRNIPKRRNIADGDRPISKWSATPPTRYCCLILLYYTYGVARDVICHRILLMAKWGLLWLPGSGRLDEVQKAY